MKTIHKSKQTTVSLGVIVSVVLLLQGDMYVHVCDKLGSIKTLVQLTK